MMSKYWRMTRLPKHRAIKIKIIYLFEKMKSIKYAVAIITILLLSLWAFEGFTKDKMYITKKDYPMAASEEDLDLFHQSMVDNNVALWFKLQQEGRGWMSKERIEVYILEKKEPNKVKVRSKNTNTEIWTIREALE